MPHPFHPPKYPMRDQEAYDERLAIVQENEPPSAGFKMEHYHLAEASGRSTHYSYVATRGLGGDWVPLLAWTIEIAGKYGLEDAVDWWFEIYNRVEFERALRERTR